MSEKEITNTVTNTQDVSSTNKEVEEQAVVPQELSNLPPVDTGKAAWLFLAAAFVVEVLTIGAWMRVYSLYPAVLMTISRFQFLIRSLPRLL
jgi:hypothetical protein